MRAAKSPGAWVVMIAVLLAIVANSSGGTGIMNANSTHAQERPANGPQPQSIREGAVLPDQVGTFKVSGDRVQFVDNESGRIFRCLENLMLQRVYQVIMEEVNPPSWIVSGKATEYRGENFLLIEAIRRAK